MIRGGTRAIRIFSWSCVCLGAVMYVGAKLHFLVRFGEATFFEEHWPFWVGMAALGVAGVLLDRLRGA